MLQDIKKVNIPAKYELGIKDKTILTIRAHNTHSNFIKENLHSKTPLVERLLADPDLNLPKFIEPKEEAWGFGKIINTMQDKDPDWVNFECQLPIISQIIEGERENDECTKAIPVSATLKGLFSSLNICEEDTNCQLPQLLIIKGLTIRSSDCPDSGLEVGLSPALITWIAKQARSGNYSNENAIMSAMIDAYQHMFFKGNEKKFKEMYGGSFEVRFSLPKWVKMDCPGDACGLDPDSDDPGLDKGYTLSSHNTDTPLQQLTLLIGVARMHELARKDGA